MNLSTLLNLDELKFIITKKYKSIIVLIMVLIIFNILYSQMNVEIIIGMKNYNSEVRIIMSILIIIIWILNKYTYLFSLGIKKMKNFSVVFRFNPNDINKYNMMRDNFLRKLKSELNSNDIEVKYIDSNKKNSKKEIDKIYNKSDSCIVFDVEEHDGKENDILLYELKIDHAHFKIDAQMNNLMVDSFKKEIINSIEQYYKITDKNSFIDVIESEKILEIGILYLASIVYIIIGRVEKGYECLVKIEKTINTIKITDKNSLNYIRIQINKRFIEIYSVVIYKFFNNDKSIFISSNIDNFVDDLYVRIIKLKNKVPKKYYECSLYDYYQTKVVRDYKIYGIEKARERMNEWYKLKYTVSYEHLLDNAFLLAHEGKYKESIDIYKRTFKVHNVRSNSITDILGFIENDKKENNYYANIFCECVINLLAADKEIAKKDLLILKKENKMLYNIIIEELSFKI